MKKLLSFILISIYLSGFISYPVDAASQSSTISKIENELYGFDYTNDSSQNRVARLEKTIYGKASTGDINKRIKRLSGDISADVIGLEIPPVEDTFREDDSEIAQADSSVNYPVVDEIEQKLFNQTYKNRDLHSRIVTIERKLFGKIYDVDDYSTRMDRIKAEVMPEALAQDQGFRNDYANLYDDNALASSDFGGGRFSRFSMPFGQRNYTRPYANYGDSFGGAAAPIGTGGNLNDELAQLEYETFGTEFSNEDTTSRIKRLNSANKAKKSSSKYDSQKFSQRMSTAMEIGAMILMILAMVL